MPIENPPTQRANREPTRRKQSVSQLPLTLLKMLPPTTRFSIILAATPFALILLLLETETFSCPLSGPSFPTPLSRNLLCLMVVSMVLETMHAFTADTTPLKWFAVLGGFCLKTLGGKKPVSLIFRNEGTVCYSDRTGDVCGQNTINSGKPRTKCLKCNVFLCCGNFPKMKCYFLQII